MAREKALGIRDVSAGGVCDNALGMDDLRRGRPDVFLPVVGTAGAQLGLQLIGRRGRRGNRPGGSYCGEQDNKRMQETRAMV